MLTLCPTSADIPVAEIVAAAHRPEVVEAMRVFYTETDDLIAARHPVCRNRGLCCRFGQFGHRLYVTTLEAAFYLATGEPPPAVTDDACPHTHDGRCHARDRRPMGCRVFFCESASRHWQGLLTEDRLARLRQLHEEINVPYVYADWMTVLEAIRSVPATCDRPTTS
ncbi:MAG TPA: hypothetical protein VLM89_12210 [Phycisphaerae bacterium]|nr:hypothetical protein [Phycisphaerae bacterium]